MGLPRPGAIASIALALVLVGCTSNPGAGQGPAPSQTLAASPNPSVEPSRSAEPTAASSSDASQESVVGTVVRFTAGEESVDVTIGEDSPATRDFLSLLPITLELVEFNGREKIADLPRELDWQGSPGSDPKDGDLIYFVPWGNIGFYYDTSGIGYSDETLHLGTYSASEEELSRFEGQQTTVEVAP
jgi:hypothetical protein